MTRRAPPACLMLLACLMQLAELHAPAVFAAVVTVNVRTPSGDAVEDAVVVFDPLDAKPPAARKTAVIDQVNKRYVPRVSVIRSGTAVSFPNSDRIRHQVYSFSAPHPFKLKLYAGSPSADEVFDKPGLVLLGCNIHDTMVAFVAVVDSPYFARIPASGIAEFNMPTGRYRLRVWHPKLTQAFVPREITAGSEPLNLPLTLAVDPTQVAAAAWPE